LELSSFAYKLREKVAFLPFPKSIAEILAWPDSKVIHHCWPLLLAKPNTKNSPLLSLPLPPLPHISRSTIKLANNFGTMEIFSAELHLHKIAI